MTEDLEVRLDLRVKLNHRVNKKALQGYVKEAVESWNGQFHPEDDLRTGIKSVSVVFPKVAP